MQLVVEEGLLLHDLVQVGLQLVPRLQLAGLGLRWVWFVPILAPFSALEGAAGCGWILGVNGHLARKSLLDSKFSSSELDGLRSMWLF